MEFTCKRCRYKTNTKGNLKLHLEKKKICEPLFEDIRRDILILELYPIKDNKYACECGKKYAHSSGLTLHKRTCNFIHANLKTDAKDKRVLSYLDNKLKEITIKCDAQQKTIDQHKIDMEKQQVDMENQQKKLERQQFEILALKSKKDEIFFQKLLEKYFDAGHKKLPSGETDITTDTMHIEIKIWNEWKAAIGQLMSYNVDDPKQELRVYLFGKYADRCRKVAIETFTQLNIIPYDFTEDFNAINLINGEVTMLLCV